MTEALVLDTSAFGRAFEAGPDREEMLGLLESRRAVVSMLVVAEARGIVNTGLRQGLTPADARTLWKHLRHGLDLARKVSIETGDYVRAQEILVRETSLVAADALHIAVAEAVGRAGARVTFITADRRQAAAAVNLVDEVRLLA
ncbi:MAG: hypothetical protein NVSMB17_00590 [Candidatus Dormibacteria bacterium]